MTKIDIILCDQDKNYIKSLEKYLMSSWAKEFSIQSFCCLPDFLKTFEKNWNKKAKDNKTGNNKTETRPVLLIGEDFYKDEEILNKINLLNSCFTVVLLGKTGLKENTLPLIFKYKHASIIAADIMGIYSSEGGRGGETIRTGSGRKEGVVVAFISANGGSGTTFISAACSILSARRGLDVFYLNFEDIPSTGFYFTSENETDFSSVIYYLKERPENLNVRLKGLYCTEPVYGIRFFKPVKNILEMNDITAEDIDILMENLKRKSSHDIIFVDLPGRIDGKVSSVLRECDIVVQVFNPGAEASERGKLLSRAINTVIREYNIPLKSRINVLNRCLQAYGPGEKDCWEPGYPHCCTQYNTGDFEFDAVIQEQKKINGKADYVEISRLLDNILERAGGVYNGFS